MTVVAVFLHLVRRLLGPRLSEYLLTPDAVARAAISVRLEQLCCGCSGDTCCTCGPHPCCTS
ncbi:hypothetical protein ACFWNQ_26800 [Streptomyces virginiae]|uniref:hypothetical protein n=1 Tax=Streptomyces virginiae TaxID=1961 RepID=UPI003663121E